MPGLPSWQNTLPVPRLAAPACATCVLPTAWHARKTQCRWRSRGTTPAGSGPGCKWRDGLLTVHAFARAHHVDKAAHQKRGTHAVACPVAFEHAVQAALPDNAADGMPCGTVVVAAIHHGLHLHTQGSCRMQYTSEESCAIVLGFRFVQRTRVLQQHGIRTLSSITSKPAGAP